MGTSQQDLADLAEVDALLSGQLHAGSNAQDLADLAEVDALLATRQPIINANTRPPINAPKFSQPRQTTTTGDIPTAETLERRQIIEQIPEFSIDFGPLGASKTLKPSSLINQDIEGLRTEAEVNKRLGDITAAALTSFNPLELAQIYTKNFPNLSSKQTKEGEIIISNSSTGEQSILGSPGISSFDLMQGLVTAGLAAPLAFLPGIAAPAATAAALETGQQIIQKLAGGTFDAVPIILSSVADFLGGKLGQKIGQGRLNIKAGIQSEAERAGLALPKKVTGLDALTSEESLIRQNIAQGRAAETALKQPNTLARAQLTMSPQDLAKQQELQSVAGSAAQGRVFAENQDAVAQKIFDQALEAIQPDAGTVLEEGPQRAVNAATAAIGKKINVRSEATQALYKTAFNDALKSGKPININSINRQLDNQIDKFAGNTGVRNGLTAIKDNLARVVERPTRTKAAGILVDKSGQPLIPGSVVEKKRTSSMLEQLHQVKRDIDARIDKATVNGNATEIAAFDSVRKNLIKTLEKSSNTYTKAQRKFAELSPPIDSLMKSTIGKMSNLVEGESIDNVALKLFNNTKITPARMKQLTKTLEETDPGVVGVLQRLYLEDILDKLTTGTLKENLPAKIRKTFAKSEKAFNLMKAASTPDVAKRLTHMREWFKRAEQGRVGGSPTEILQQAQESMKKEFTPHGGKAFRAIVETGQVSRLKLAEKLTGMTDSEISEATNRAAAKVYLDPKWKEPMAKIRKLPLGSDAAGRAFSQILNRAIQAEILQEAQ